MSLNYRKLGLPVNRPEDQVQEWPFKKDDGTLVTVRIPAGSGIDDPRLQRAFKAYGTNVAPPAIIQKLVKIHPMEVIERIPARTSTGDRINALIDLCGNPNEHLPKPLDLGNVAARGSALNPSISRIMEIATVYKIEPRHLIPDAKFTLDQIAKTFTPVIRGTTKVAQGEEAEEAPKTDEQGEEEEICVECETRTVEPGKDLCEICQEDAVEDSEETGATNETEAEDTTDEAETAEQNEVSETAEADPLAVNEDTGPVPASLQYAETDARDQELAQKLDDSDKNELTPDDFAEEGEKDSPPDLESGEMEDADDILGDMVANDEPGEATEEVGKPAEVEAEA